MKAIGKSNGELIVGESAAEEKPILLLMEVHLLFINLFSKRYATLQLNQLTGSHCTISAPEHHPPMAQKTQGSCLGETKGSQKDVQVLLCHALYLGSMHGSP